MILVFRVPFPSHPTPSFSAFPSLVLRLNLCSLYASVIQTQCKCFVHIRVTCTFACTHTHARQVASLLDEYVQGTRTWLYDKISTWLDQALCGQLAGDEAASRMFLLLAGAGMGKSVFSAVMHERLVAFASGGHRKRSPVILVGVGLGNRTSKPTQVDEAQQTKAYKYR